MKRPARPPERPYPFHLFPTEIEEEFVVAMISAAQRAGAGDKSAQTQYHAGLAIDPQDIAKPPVRTIYEALIRIVLSDQLPSWGVLKHELTKGAGRTDASEVHLPYLADVVRGGAFVSAIPTYVLRIQEAAAGRREWKAAEENLNRIAHGEGSG